MLLLLLSNCGAKPKICAMKKHLILILLIASAGFYPLKAQYFTDIEADLTHVMHAGGAWIDKDDDGDLDLIVTGGYLADEKPVPSSKFYTNVNRNRVFRYMRTGITNISYGAVSTGDYDNDGDIDLIITGENTSGNPVTILYDNQRNNKFTRVNTGLPALKNGDVKMADFNRDGNPDVALCGRNAAGRLITAVYKGDGKGNFSPVNINAPGIEEGEMAWGDYDNDGYYDLFITGKNENGKAVSQLYRFNGNRFVNSILSFPARKNSAADWGDYDNDGDLDIALTGENDNGNISQRILVNNGGNSFTPISVSLPGTRSGSIDWGDYDHDGDLDLLITGENSEKKPFSAIYRNDRNNDFTNIEAGLQGVYLSDAEWGDYDNDGDLDIFLAGLSHDFRPASKIYRNERIQKEEAATKTDDDTPDSESIWQMYDVPAERAQTLYYFLTSSCYCRPDSTYKKDGYHMFISEAFSLNIPHYHQHTFFKKIIDNHNRWGEIKEAYPSQGYKTMKAARKGRERFISSYTNQGYKIHYIPWGDHPSMSQ